jgi:hypothetical protein
MAPELEIAAGEGVEVVDACVLFSACSTAEITLDDVVERVTSS